MKLDTRDKIALALIIIAIVVVAWAGYNAMACVKVMQLYEESGGYGWVCESCNILANAGIVTSG